MACCVRGWCERERMLLFRLDLHCEVVERLDVVVVVVIFWFGEIFGRTFFREVGEIVWRKAVIAKLNSSREFEIPGVGIINLSLRILKGNEF